MARVLLVDDDVQTLDVLDFSLTLEGHEVTRAVNGAAGVEAARRTPLDLVILDSMMPVMDGLTAARELRSDPATAHVPIIMLTARVTDADVWHGYRAGVDSYIPKPLDLHVLQDEMARLGLGARSPMEV